MSFRRLLFWMHLIAGVVAGSVILIMSVTGLLLAFERQILAHADHGAYHSGPAGGMERLPIDELLARLGSTAGGLPRSGSLVFRSDPAAPVEISLGREGSIFASPYDGRILGRGRTELRQTFQRITAWHRWLGMAGEGRETASAITGACNLAFLFLIASGIYLWLPKVWSRQHLRPILWFKSGVSGRARDFNWHNTFGIWAAIPLLIVVACAVPISYGWANGFVYWIAGSEAPVRATEKGGPRRNGSPRVNPYEGPPIGAAWRRAEQQVAGWQSIAVRLPDRAATEISFTIDAGDGGQPQKRGTLVIDATTGEVKKWEPYSSGSPGRRLRTWARFTHTGEYYGVIGQTIAGAACLASVLLVWTGISLALRRLDSQLTKRK